MRPRHPGGFYIPPGLSGAKKDLFDALAGCFTHAVRGSPRALDCLVPEITPVVSCRPGIGAMARKWRISGRPFLYWDRGYVRRGGKAGLFRARGDGQGYLRWTLGDFQMHTIEPRADKRWRQFGIEVAPWRRGGAGIVIAAPSDAYADFHGLRADWTEQTRALIARHSGRPVTVRRKGAGRSLAQDLIGAHCLVTHGSVAAVEAVILGVPVFVDPISAAAPMGRTDLTMIEDPARPERRAWLASLAWSQFTVPEALDGTMWRETVERALA